MSSEVRIEVPRDIWPYGPPTALLEKDIRDLLKELPDLRYGLIENLYPAVYWDTPLARFAVIPLYIQKELLGYPPRTHYTYFSPKPEALVVFDVVVNNKRFRVFGIPCLQPELGKYISVPMDAVVVMPRERIYIKPELVTFRTEFYGGVQSIYALVRELLAGEADRLAETNIIGCFFRTMTLLPAAPSPPPEDILKEITRHIVETTLIPEERIRSLVRGICIGRLAESFKIHLQTIVEHMPIHRTILLDESKYLQRYLVGEFIASNIMEYRDFLSMKDLCEGGMNKAYEETIKGNIIDRTIEILQAFIHVQIPKTIRKNYKELLLPYIPNMRGLEPWMLEMIMSPKHPFRRRVEEYAESTMVEIMERYLKIKDRPGVLTFSTEFRKKYMRILDRDLEGIVKLYPKTVPPGKLEEYFVDTLVDLLEVTLQYEPRDLIVSRILAELYDKPIHVIVDLYVATDDYLAFSLHDTLQRFIDRYPYNAWEAIKSRFGIKSVGITPQRLDSRR